MFNPKFKAARPSRWELGRKLQGKQLRIAKEEADLKAQAEADALRIQQLHLAQEAELKAKAAIPKKKAPARKNAVKKTKTTRKSRTKKD